VEWDIRGVVSASPYLADVQMNSPEVLLSSNRKVYRSSTVKDN
jgi:hypothetical protein